MKLSFIFQVFGFLSFVFIFDFAFGQSGSWSALVENGQANAPPFCQSSSAAYSALDNQLIFYGGLTPGNLIISNRYRYDVASQSWLSLNSDNGPGGRYGHTAVVYKGDMFIFGGIGATNGPVPVSDLFWGYGLDGSGSLKQDFWSGAAIPITDPNSSTLPRAYHSACVIGDTMYIYGGLTTLGPSIADSDLRTYNFTGNTWSTITGTGTSPGPLAYHTAVVIGNKMLIFGGVYTSSGTSPTVVATLYIFNTASNSWTQGKSNSVALEQQAAVSLGTTMFIFGGWNSAAYSNLLYAYDSTSNLWSSLASTSNDSYAASVVITSLNQILVFRGYSAGSQNSGFVWTPNGQYVPVTTALYTTVQSTTSSIGITGSAVTTVFSQSTQNNPSVTGSNPSQTTQNAVGLGGSLHFSSSLVLMVVSLLLI